MKMDETQRVPAPQAKVWAALNDPKILQACIPGCEQLHMTSPTDMDGVVVVKVGPVKASFTGKVTLSDLDPPNGYRISGEGSGGVAGFAKGGATVKLASEGANATLLHYVVDAQIGGRLAQLGGRLIDATAKKLAGEFFQSFAAAVASAEAPAPTVAVAAPSAERAPGGWFARLVLALRRLLGLEGAARST
jgi:carbon monoxide dehydrogenase subunit G